MLFQVIFNAYVEIIAQATVFILRFLHVTQRIPATEVDENLNETLEKLDSARKNLLDGVTTVDELRRKIEEDKAKAAQALQQLAQMEKDKSNLENEMNAIKNLVNSDVDAFRHVAGIPGKKQIQRERIYGFISGVIASLLAAGIIYGITRLVLYLTD